MYWMYQLPFSSHPTLDTQDILCHISQLKMRNLPPTPSYKIIAGQRSHNAGERNFTAYKCRSFLNKNLLTNTWQDKERLHGLKNTTYGGHTEKIDVNFALTISHLNLNIFNLHMTVEIFSPGISSKQSGISTIQQVNIHCQALHTVTKCERIPEV